MLRSKFFKFLLSILKGQVDSSPNFVSLFSVMKDNSSLLFHLKLYMLSTKGTHQVQIFRFSTAHIKINQIPHVNSSSDFALLFSVMKITPMYFFSCNEIYFVQKEPIKGKDFETSKCSGETLPYTSCHFPNHKSIFLQILHHSSVS